MKRLCIHITVSGYKATFDVEYEIGLIIVESLKVGLPRCNTPAIRGKEYNIIAHTFYVVDSDSNNPTSAPKPTVKHYNNVFNIRGNSDELQ